MCGIIGFITAETTKGANERRRFFTQALIADQFRGEDATGLIAVPHAKAGELAHPWWYKQAAISSTFVQNELYRTCLNQVAQHKYMVGHNRFGTTGNKAKTENAHPFTEGPIILVHNGGLQTMYNLPTPKSELPMEVEVDSHVICHNLAVHDVAEVVAELDGAYVLVWHDARDDSLNIIRNHQRPLAMAKDLDSNTLLFASEAPMLQWIADRNNIRIGKMVEPKAGHLLTFKQATGIVPTVRELKMYSGVWQGGGRFRDFSRGGIRAASVIPAKSEAAVALPFSQGPSERRPSSLERRPRRLGEQQLLPTVSVLLNKRYVEMPETLESNLTSYSIDVQDTIRFTPCNAAFLNADGRIYGRVEGILSTGETAYMYNIPASAYYNNNTNDWVVSPLCVLENVSEDGNDVETVVVVRPFKYAVPDDYSFRSYYAKEEEEEETTSTDIRAASILDRLIEGEERLRGPGTELVSRTKFMELVKNGCAQCCSTIFPRMDEEIVWLSDNTPVCPDCVDQERFNMFNRSQGVE